MEYYLLVAANLSFLAFWITRKHPVIKFLATGLLACYAFNIANYYLALQFALFSLGDIALEIYPLNKSLALFTAGKLIKLL